MVSIIAFGKLCSGAKTLGWQHSNWDFENVFKNLGIRNNSIDGFQRGFEKWRKRRWWIYEKGHCV
jgi:hypothetical protein